MASAFYSNTVHIDFASVLAMEIPGIVSVLHALTASGLEGFLGCPAVVYESELVEFFKNGLVRDDLVVSTVNGVPIEISEQFLAETFELPMDGLSELSKMPKDKIYDARSIVSMSGEPVNLSGRKGQMKIEYRLLCDIMAKSISVKAGSFNALTLEKFALLTAVVCGVKMNWASVLFNIFKKMVSPGAKQAKGYAVQISLLLENIPNLNLGESSEFPVSKILTAKTVHRYISVTDKESTQEVADASPVKLAPKKPGASKKRPAAIRWKHQWSRTQEAIPIQIIPATPAVEPMVEDQEAKIVEKHPADVVAATASEQEPVGEQVEEQPAVESSLEKPAAESAAEETADDISEKADAPVVEPVMANVVDNEVSNADDVDTIIQQVLSETVLSASTEEEQIEELDIRGSAVTGLSTVSIDERHWFDLSHEELIARWDAERPVTTPPDTDEEIEVERKIGIAEGAQAAFSQPEYTIEKQADMELDDDDKFVYEWFDDDEARSLEDVLLSIPLDIPLPSAGMEISKIVMGKEIKIPEVTERTWFLNILPKIPDDHKGKAILVEKDPIKGNPAQEHYFLICADVDLLVALRAKVIDEVAQFFNSFSLKKLATINIEEMYKKEEQVLSWGETDSPQLAIQRKLYILLKYREVLVRKFLESWKSNFVPGQGSSAVDLRVIELLSDLHLFILEELIKEARAHGLSWTKPCCSGVFEGEIRDRGVVIARSNTYIRSSCWIRTMLRVDGAWIIEPCADRWVKIPRQISSYEVQRQRQYDDSLPPVNNFFKILTKRWADIQVLIQYSLFSILATADITDFLSSIALERTALRDEQRSFAQSVVPSVQFSFDQRQSSPPSIDSSSSLHFDTTDLDATASSLPSVSIDFSAALADFQVILSKQINESQSGISSRLHKIEHDEQAKVFKNLFQEARQEGRTIDDVQTLRFNEFHKNTLAQNASIFTGLADVRKEVQEVNAKVDIMASRLNDVQKNVEDTKEAISHLLLEFQSQAQANQNVLHAQLSEIVNYINRGSAEKKEESSSRGPQQPPNVQIRDSGTSGGSAVRTPDFA
ncbi:dystroglycan-like [Dorcoceras hygrometricum]|uniref:Dystroglycan-like n=1 Tax=Dorcoceras hygrometricum TaxID=472368 RepID=A0A2Z7C8R3_9LAMI|nr:dystroglycan-like [Dorcoceras hygrometricum]